MKDPKDNQTLDAFSEKPKRGRPSTTKTAKELKDENAERQKRFRLKAKAKKNAIIFAIKTIQDAQRKDDLPLKSAANKFLLYLNGENDEEINVKFEAKGKEFTQELNYEALVELINDEEKKVIRFF